MPGAGKAFFSPVLSSVHLFHTLLYLCCNQLSVLLVVTSQLSDGERADDLGHPKVVVHLRYGDEELVVHMALGLNNDRWEKWVESIIQILSIVNSNGYWRGACMEACCLVSN